MATRASRMVEYESRVFARDVANFMDTLGIERAVIVGHSMGATVAQRFAVDYPQRVRALVSRRRILSRVRPTTELRKFLEEVPALKDPIDPGFVRDFQQSTLAQPVPPEFFDTVVGEAMKVPARVWQAALQPYLAMDFSTDLANSRGADAARVGRSRRVHRTERAGRAESCDQDVAARGLRRCRSQPALGRAAALCWSGGLVRGGPAGRVCRSATPAQSPR